MNQSVDKSGAAVPTTDSPKTKQKRKIPSPRELVAHYESQGMETQVASLKVIQDLQNALFRKMVSNRRDKRASPGESSDVSRKLDVINGRLVQLEMKIDSKPGYPQMLAVGVTSGAVVGALTSATTEIWAAVQRATGTSS